MALTIWAIATIKIPMVLSTLKLCNHLNKFSHPLSFAKFVNGIIEKPIKDRAAEVKAKYTNRISKNK